MKFKEEPMRAINVFKQRRAGLFLCGLLVIAVGCMSNPTIRKRCEQWWTIQFEPTLEQQIESVRPIENTLVQGLPLKVFALFSSTLAFHPASAISVKFGETDSGNWNYRVEFKEKELEKLEKHGEQYAVMSGVAVPITKDGYFLTAFHVVDPLMEHMALFPICSEENQAKNPRIVWKGTVDDFDFAILHIDAELRHVVEWSPELPKLGETVFTGFGINGNPAAGKILEVERFEYKSISASKIEFDAPVRKGDSGSGVFDLNGKLLGVLTTFQVETNPLKKPIGVIKSALALRPDPEFVRRIIEEDRHTHIP